MPEGDVLRRTAAALDEALAGRALTRAELRWPSAAGVDLVGRTVLGTRPYGKHLLTRIEGGLTLHTHLRMDGEWRVERDDPARPASDPRVRALLGTPERLALGRLLGMLDVVRTRDEHTLVGHLGPDVLDDTFDADGAATGLPPGVAGSVGIDAPDGWPGRGTAGAAGLDEGLARFAARGSEPVAEVLLDQRVVAGIGTIFTSESLFVVRAWPWGPADAVRDPAALLRTARRLMAEAVHAGYPRTRVHMKDGRPCVRCGTRIRKRMARRPPNERPIWFCPRCQGAPD